MAIIEFLSESFDNTNTQSLFMFAGVIATLARMFSKHIKSQERQEGLLQSVADDIHKLGTQVEYADSRLDEHEVKLAIMDERQSRHDNRITRLENEL